MTCHPVLLRHLSQQHRLSPTLCPLPPPPPHTSQGHKPNYPGKRWRHRPRSLPAAPGTRTSPLFCICPPATHRPIKGHHGSGQFPPPARTPKIPLPSALPNPGKDQLPRMGVTVVPPAPAPQPHPPAPAPCLQNQPAHYRGPASPSPHGDRGSRVPIALWGPRDPRCPKGTRGSRIPIALWGHGGPASPSPHGDWGIPRPNCSVATRGSPLPRGEWGSRVPIAPWEPGGPYRPIRTGGSPSPHGNRGVLHPHHSMRTGGSRIPIAPWGPGSPHCSEGTGGSHVPFAPWR